MKDFVEKQDTASQNEAFFIHLKLHSDFSEEGGDPITLFRKLRAVGKLIVIPHTTAVPLLEEYNPKQLYIRWTIRLITQKSRADLMEILLSVIVDVKNTVTIETITLPPSDPNSFNQIVEEKQLFEQSTDMKLEANQKIPPTKTLESMAVKIGKNIFTIADAFIVESFKVQQIDIVEKNGNLTIENGAFPLLQLHKLLNLQSKFENFTQASIIVLEYAKQKIGFLVDEIMPQSPVVTYNVEESFEQLPYIKGAVILESGEIAFILDVPAISMQELEI